MDNFNSFVTELQELEIRLTEVPSGTALDISHYSQRQRDYERKIRRLQQIALTDILVQSPDSIRLQLRRLELVNKKFDSFWKVYEEIFPKFQDGHLTVTDLEVQVYPLFITTEKRGQITLAFMHGLHDAVMQKQEYLLDFNNQVIEVLDFKETGKPPISEPEVLGKVTARQCVMYLLKIRPNYNRPDFMSSLKNAGFTWGTARNEVDNLEKFLRKEHSDRVMSNYEIAKQELDETGFELLVKEKLHL